MSLIVLAIVGIGILLIVIATILDFTGAGNGSKKNQILAAGWLNIIGLVFVVIGFLIMMFTSKASTVPSTQSSLGQWGAFLAANPELLAL